MDTSLSSDDALELCHCGSVDSGARSSAMFALEFVRLRVRRASVSILVPDLDRLGPSLLRRRG